MLRGRRQETDAPHIQQYRLLDRSAQYTAETACLLHRARHLDSFIQERTMESDEQGARISGAAETANIGKLQLTLPPPCHQSRSSSNSRANKVFVLANVPRITDLASRRQGSAVHEKGTLHHIQCDCCAPASDEPAIRRGRCRCQLEGCHPKDGCPKDTRIAR